MIATVILIFLLNPFLALVIFGAYLNMNRKLRPDSYFYLFYFLLALFLSFINMTKVPENDLAYHSTQYLQAKNYSYSGYLDFIGKEVAFYSFNYWFNYFTGGSIKYWVLVLTFASYFPFFVAIHKFQKRVSPDSQYILFSVCLAAFFPQLFSLSAHLMRQFIAGGLLVYFLNEKLIFNSNKWWLAIIGTLLHSSSLILFALAYVWFLKERPNKRNFHYFLILFFILGTYQVVSQLLLPIFSDSMSVSYALTRASKDTKFDLGSFAAINYFFIATLLYILFKEVYVKNLQKIISGVEHFGNIIVILTFFILINLQQSELSNRLFFYLCFFFPFIIPIALKRQSFSIIRKVLTLSIILFFLYRLEFGTWTYDSISELLSSSTYSFLSREEFKL